MQKIKTKSKAIIDEILYIYIYIYINIHKATIIYKNLPHDLFGVLYVMMHFGSKNMAIQLMLYNCPSGFSSSSVKFSETPIVPGTIFVGTIR